MCTTILNPELNGIELYFNDKPESTIISMLKEYGYRWHNVKKCWYAKQNTETMNTAAKLADNNTEAASTVQTVEQTKENKEINVTSFYPNYSEVGDSKIYKSSDFEINNNHGGYFSDINAYVHFYCDSCVIIDLSNALQTGKECKRYSISLIDRYNRENYLVCDLWNVNHIETFKQLYDAIISNQPLKGITIDTGDTKGINTFSPFTEIKPIKTPTKWTISHVWKAILSGQIYKGVKDQHLTDDYAGDAADNFGTGRSLDLPYFAESLICHSSGWHVYVDKEENGIIQLSVNCHSFDYNTLYFDVNSNIIKAEQKAQAEAQTITEHNEKMLAEVQEIESEQYSQDNAYTVKYLQMNNNTGMYEYKTELLQYNQIFYTDTVYPLHGEEYEEVITNYKIVSIIEYVPESTAIYEISNTFSRLQDDTDSRIINAGMYIHYVTGYALTELLKEHYYLPMIRQNNTTFDRLSDDLHAHYEPIERNGFIISMSSSLFQKDDTDYRTEHNKLIKEFMRIPKARTA